MSRIPPFSIARLPRIVFGAGASAGLADELKAFGRRVLLITGARSFRATPGWERLCESLGARGLTWEAATVHGEPSPQQVDQMVAAYRSGGFDVVAGIGGGSALDAAKAVAGLLRPGNSVLDHLEGVGPERPYLGPATPFVAVPTTAGTGSEATRNAVLSLQGDDGYKKSFRHDDLVAQVAIVDPALLKSCSRDLLAAGGMDAFTQLLESFVSIKANPITDALAWSGMAAFRDGFFAAWSGNGNDEDTTNAGRDAIAYASLLSGITLAQCGLGAVHGLASPLGAYFPIPHGVACGTLLAEATAINIKALRERAPASPALAKYARVGALLSGRNGSSGAEEEELASLVTILRRWVADLALPKLGRYGMTLAHVTKVVAGSRGGSMKTNPIVLNDAELGEIVHRRLE
ncbi:MAG: iron-containing alcohol dehydrogenase [Alphaproteobacteria bacterium]|nr:iron-containing alcohol dehydrogenase [Alphaproteobacteria bacterium]